MRDDYLWDKSGEPDPEVAKLERTLGALGHRDDTPLDLPETIPAPPRAPVCRPSSLPSSATGAATRCSS